LLNFNHLYYFHVSASEGSLARAAERLGVTQPTVSEQIRLLERNLGVKLFERSTTGLSLTDAGRRVYEHTVPMFKAGERLAVVLGAPNPDEPALHVALTRSAAAVVAPERLVPFFAPERRTSVRVGDTAELMRQLRARELDVLVCTQEVPITDESWARTVIVDRPELVAIASPALEVDEHWTGVPLVAAGNGVASEVREHLRRKGLAPRPIGDTEYPQLAVELAAGGAAIAIVTASVARTAIEDGRVRMLAALGGEASIVYAVAHDGATALAALERLQAPESIAHLT
jgi:LysR family transcriptional regulator, transcriptional activator of nhaA